LDPGKTQAIFELTVIDCDAFMTFLISGIQIARSGRYVVSVSTSRSREAPTSRLGLVSVSAIHVSSRAKDVIFHQIIQATLIQCAKSVVAIYGGVNSNRLMHYLLTVDGSCRLTGMWSRSRLSRCTNVSSRSRLEI